MAKQIMGVDPGTTNFGFCVIDSETLKPLSSGRRHLALRKGGDEGADAKVVNAVGDVLAPLVEPVQVVGCEQQMRRQMDIVCGGVLGFAKGHGKQVISVAPAAVKRRFDIEPGGSREKNKILALDKCREWGFDFETDHEADAYLVARYVALILKGQKKKPKSVHVLRSRQPALPHRSGGPRCGNVLLVLERETRVQQASGDQETENPTRRKEVPHVSTDDLSS